MSLPPHFVDEKRKEVVFHTFRLTNTYMRNGSNLLKVAGNEPTMSATAPRTTATIAASTKRSFQLYFISK